MPPKQRTKGKQEIYNENQAALEFYWRISLCSSAVQIISVVAFFSWLRSLATALMIGMHYLAIRVMRSIARPKFSGNQLIDGGIDLSLTNGMGEHMKDLILFSALLQFGALFTDYFWCLIVVAPIRVVYIVWPLLSPWLRSSSENVQEKPKPKPNPRKERRIYK
ncbi:putative membrane protein [Oopsacas minuta]|uniref:Transmembrane protein 208 n=1 Tax=Oopsacas minuta TaxID=111878 RepID=A0AAV7JJY3_9METZ|nr:putative membrane protein [Oopsacas minuta]